MMSVFSGPLSRLQTVWLNNKNIEKNPKGCSRLWPSPFAIPFEGESL